jgi:hypothetical protein
LYAENLKNALEQQVRNNAIRTGFFGQLPATALEATTAADVETRKAAAIAELAQQLVGRSMDDARQVQAMAMQQRGQEAQFLMNALQMARQYQEGQLGLEAGRLDLTNKEVGLDQQKFAHQQWTDQEQIALSKARQALDEKQYQTDADYKAFLKTQGISETNAKKATAGYIGQALSKPTREDALGYITANSAAIANDGADMREIIAAIDAKYGMHISDLQGIGLTSELAIAELVGLCSGALERLVQESMVVLGNMTVGGTIAKVEEFANVLQVCVDAGAKRVLIPAASVVDFQTVPPDLLIKIQPVFYSDPTDAVFKA